jgi:hypothetical protein
MEFFILDAGGAGLIYLAYGILVLFMILVIVVEALILVVLKYNSVSRSLRDSSIINIASLAVGFVLLEYTNDLVNLDTLQDFLILYIVTVIIEFGILWMLNKARPISRTLGICIFMNILTYAFLYTIGQSN